jgi:hypothetical protein
MIMSLCVFVILFWCDLPSLVNYAYPASVSAIGLWLYSTRPALYLGYTWWIWFTTPFMRRLVDYEVGYFNPVSPVMLAPYMVTGIAILTVIQSAGRLAQRSHRPFFLIILGIVYAYLIGLAKVGPLSATLDLLSWLLPVVLALHIHLRPNLVSQHKRVVLSTFTWAVLAMGLYGLVQYAFAPAWDMKWLVWSGMTSSMGDPFAGEFRVFSTLNSTGPFAFVMTAGLLLLFAGRGTLPWLAAAPGYFGFLLSLVRAAWGGWFIGVAYLAWRLKGKMKMRLVMLLAITAVLSVPLFMFAPNTNRAANRAETLTNLEEDVSFRARVGIHLRATAAFLRTPVGNGLGNYGTAAKMSKGEVVSFDSGVFAVLLTLGWIGSLVYVGGLIWLLIRIFRSERHVEDLLVTTLTGIVFAFMGMMIFLNQLNGVTGVVLWPLLSLALVTVKQKYAHNNERAPA